MNRVRRKSGAFTLIELMVVITILGILMAILIPAMGGARDQAREGGTKAQLMHIATACESYYSDYGAYPGVFDDKQFKAGDPFTGSQNLYLTLTRRFYPTGMAVPAGSTATMVSLASGASVQFDQDPNKPTANYSTARGPLTEGTSPFQYNLHDSYYPVNRKEISNTSGLIMGYGRAYNVGTLPAIQTSIVTADNLGGLPCLVDYSFPVAQQPILYYRSNYKYNPEYDTTKGGTNRPGFATAIVGVDNSSAANRYTYYTAPESGLVPSMDPATLQALLPDPPPPGGGFVLLATDRTRTKYSIIQKSY